MAGKLGSTDVVLPKANQYKGEKFHPANNIAKRTGFTPRTSLSEITKNADDAFADIYLKSDERTLQLQNDFAPPVSSESIEGGTNRPDLEQEIINEDVEGALQSSFNTFPDDFLIINDVYLYKVPTANISLTSATDVFVGETLRTKAPIITSEGRQDFVLNLSLPFRPGREQTEDLRRLISELSKHPLVFVFNNKIRQSIGVEEFTSTMFVLEAGTLRSSSESTGTIVLDLQLHYFNHKPFSNNFYFNAKMPGISYSSEDKVSHIDVPIKLEDLRSYEASDYSLSFQAQKIREDIRNTVRQINDTKGRNVPVNFPSESDSWMYYADHLTNMTPLLSDTPSDYIGFSVRKYELKHPPDDAKQSLGTLANSMAGVKRPSVKSIYDALKPLPDNKTYQQSQVEESFNSSVQPAALEGTPIRFKRTMTGIIDDIILTSSPGVVHPDASERLSSLANIGKHSGSAMLSNGLIIHLQRIANRFPGRTINIYSGSRFPRKEGGRSKHVTGDAVDFTVSGVSKEQVFRFIKTLPNSGAGYYPNSLFSHIDYRHHKTWWIDTSGPGEKSSYLKASEKTDYYKEHVLGSTDGAFEAKADKEENDSNQTTYNQQKDIAALQSDERASEEEELYRNQTKQDPSIGHKVNPPVSRSLEARKKWIEGWYNHGWVYYDSGDGKIRNVFYKEDYIDIDSDVSARRYPNTLKNIVCSAISIQFGHRIAPMRLLSQNAYTYQFLGAGNKSGQMVFTFAGEDGRQSANRLKSIFITARENARNFGSMIKEAGSIRINSSNLNTGNQNTILALLNVEDIIVTNIKESSLPESVDKHQLVIEFIVQEFEEESFERRLVTSVDNRRRIIKKLLSYLTRNKYGVVPKPSVAKYNPSESRPYIVTKGVPSWVAKLVGEAATLCREIDKQMPPADWRVETSSAKTWRDIYKQWGADKVMEGSWENIYILEQNGRIPGGRKTIKSYAKSKRVAEAGGLGSFLSEAYAARKAVGDVFLAPVGELIDEYQSGTERMKKGEYDFNGLPETNNTHNDLYREWLRRITEIAKQVKKFIEDEENFEKYFGSIGSDMLNAITDDKGQCYSDLLLPNMPYSSIPLPPEFYVYDDSDESPIISSLTDPKNMEKFLKKHVENEITSISLYMRERFLGGSYLSKNLPRILENRRYYDEQMAGEYDFFDNFWKIFQEGATAWEPITYKEDITIDGNTEVQKWKTFTYAGIGATNEEEARYNYVDSLTNLSQYLNKGRHWQSDWTQQDNQNLINNLYGKEYDKICFGPNQEYNRTDAAAKGIALPERSLSQIRAIEESAAASVANRNNKTIHLTGGRNVLPTGEVVVGDSEYEKFAKENSFFLDPMKFGEDLVKQATDFSVESTVAHIMLLPFTGLFGLAAAVLPAVESAQNAEVRAFQGQSVSKIIQNLDHSVKNKVNSSNESDQISSMISGICIGSKADDLSIRRVYPTFKIYFIEDDSQDTEKIDGKVIRAFDDFYSYSAVQEIKITRSRKIASDLAVIRITNIGGILLRRKFGEKDPSGHKDYERQGLFADTEKEHPFEKMILQDGIKVQIRLGYASDPDNLESVFLGQIVEIAPAENGKILELMCQGYGAELESIELGELEDGPIYTSTQQALSAAIIQDSIATFGRQSKFNRFNPAEIRHAWTGGNVDSLIGTVNPINILRNWADRNMDQHFQKYTFLNYPQDDNIYAPPPSSYASKWMRFWNNACIYRPLKQTPWQIFKEHELRHPGYISLAVPYGHSPRMTMFFGQKMQHYWSKPPSALELYASENAYNMLVRMRGMSVGANDKSLQQLVNRLSSSFRESPKLTAAILKDLVLSGAPTKTSQALGEQFGRYKPFRNYHYFDTLHHILKNEIRTSVDGTFNEVEILFFEDEDNIQTQDAEELVEAIQSLGLKQEGAFAVKLDENIPESSLRSYREEFPSCITVDMARRYAQGIFARHLRDAYKGELVVIGKETLKPYDVCYLNDSNINMTGPIEVEQVTHIFNRDYGFISIITPDLCVEVNDMFSATIFDVAGAGMNMSWGWGDAALGAVVPAATVLKGLGLLAVAAGVKMSMWTQDGDPVVPTPLTLGGKPFMSVSLGPNQSSLFLNLHGRWVQYWDDLEDAWHKFDIAEELFDARVSLDSKIYSMFGTGARG